jgi:hypothetical protein
MTNTERDKAICVALGIEWHESAEDSEKVFIHVICSCGRHFKCQDTLERHIDVSNPDFSTDSGKVMLLREVMKLEDWFEFSKIIGFWSVGLRPLKTRHFFIKSELITDTTGKFALEVYDWLVKTGRIK